MDCCHLHTADTHMAGPYTLVADSTGVGKAHAESDMSVGKTAVLGN